MKMLRVINLISALNYLSAAIDMRSM